MIPKIIHYCWFSNERQPENVQKCIQSWRDRFQGWTIKCWGPESFDFDSVPFVKEAIEKKKWAFASDYIRLYALFTEGGIYLDSDVQAWDSIDDWVGYDFFTGIEMRDKEHTQIYPEAAIMGSVPGHLVVAETMAHYQGRHFVQEDGSLDMTPIPTVMLPVLEAHGWARKDETQVIGQNSVVFSTEEIANTNCERRQTVRLYHLNNRSWIPLTLREKVIRLVKRVIKCENNS